MRKGFFKFRVSRVIPTFQSCRSKDPSTLPSNPIPSFLHHHHHHHFSAATATKHKLNHVSTATPSPSPRPKPHPKQSHHRFSLKSHVSSAFSSARRGCLKSRPSPEPSHTQSPPQLSSSSFKWHVITKVPTEYHNYDSTPPRRKIYNSAASDTERENDVVFLPPLPSKTRPKRIRRHRRRTTSTTTTKSLQKGQISTSSDSGLFSEDDNDSQTLFSSDTPSPLSRHHHHHHHRHVIKSMKREKFKKNNKSGRRSSVDGNMSPVPARLSEFMRKMAPCRAVASGKVRESFAMVKKSEEPYEDFKRSMAEMVVEKQMFQEQELEELLRCFLSLNSEHHHEAIVRAFTEIWQGLFCQSSSSSKE